MANRTINTKIKLRNDTSANWISKNPILLLGELGLETDTRKIKVGDGVSTWNTLNYSDAQNANTANKLATTRIISITGDATGSASFDGSENTAITIVLANSGITAGTYTKLTVNSKGLVTGSETLSATDIPNLTLSKITDAGTASSKNVGVGIGDVVQVGANGKISESVLPELNKVSSVNGQTGEVVLTNSDIGLGNVTNEKQYSANNPPPYPVTSVAGKTGAVTLTKSDVGLSSVVNPVSGALSFTGSVGAYTQTINHNLGTTNIAVEIYDSSGNIMYCDYQKTSANQVILKSNVSISGTYLIK